ncbi:MAG: cell division protein ZapE, partial [Corallincola sp.]|nr:cell division protein ZapE [Corallincola sp.]
QLYQGGLHRDRFLPAIALLKSITRVVHLDGGQDYRLRTLTRAAIHLVAEADGDARLEALAVELAPEPPLRDQQLTVCERPLPCRLVADDLVWFDFAILCRSARSQLDYIELARRFHTVLVSDVPQLGSDDDDAARRFIALVDEFYDRGVKLVMTQAVATADLYQGERLAFAFARCVSRLTEMQSESYLARPHTPA